MFPLLIDEAIAIVPLTSGPAFSFNFGKRELLDTVAAGEKRAIAFDFVMPSPRGLGLLILQNNGVEVCRDLFA